MLNLLWLLPLAAVVLILQGRKKKRALQVFADAHLLARLAARNHHGRRFIKALLLLLSMGLMLFALAGPRWGSHYEEVSQKGVDIMLLIDVSPSMLVEDISPNRLERARREILDFMKVVQGDRLGLVAFAGAAFIQCPLTLDYAALEMFLSALQPDLIPVPGTDLGAAIDMGISAFDDESATDKVILLITDGEDNEKRGIEAARQAAATGVKVFIFGIGDVSGGPIPEFGGSGGYKKDRQGNLILSKLDEDGLQAIADKTGGTYVRSVAGDLDLDHLYFDGIKSRTRAQELKSGKIKVYEERFPLFVLAAFILLLLEGFVDEKVRLKSGARDKARLARAGLLFLVMAGGVTMTAVRTEAAESPDELYRKGRFAEAEEAYAQGDMDNPKDLRYRYNRGVAAYQKGDYQTAAAAFASVLRRSQNDDLRFKAAYNLGNTKFKQQDYKSAIEHYKKALAQDPASEDARHNLELAAVVASRRENNQPDQQGGDQSQPGSDQQQDQSGGENQQSDPGRQQGEQSPQPDSAQSQQNENRSQDSNDGRRESAEQPSEKKGGEGQAGQPSQQELTGELKARQTMPPIDEGKQGDPAGIMRMNQKKAEALLDNIQEDRAYMIRRQTGDRSVPIGSGKDW